MNEHDPIDILCRYRVKPTMGEPFERMLTRHWQALHDEGLTTDEPARVRHARDQAGNIAYIEEFSWKNGACVQAAHESPVVMRLWEPMGALCEDMEFWQIGSIDA